MWDLVRPSRRNHVVRVLALLAAVAALAVPAAAGNRQYERPAVGLSVLVPDGWTVVERPLTPCSNPVQRLALRGRGALVQLQERLGVTDLNAYPPRSRRFRLPGKARWIACCSPEERKGWMFPFRDAGRGFYAYVYLGGGETRREALAILDSLRVRPR